VLYIDEREWLAALKENSSRCTADEHIIVQAKLNQITVTGIDGRHYAPYEDGLGRWLFIEAPLPSQKLAIELSSNTMNSIPTDAELLACHQRRQRWVVRISLSLLLMVMLLPAAVIILIAPTSISIEEAKALHNQLTDNCLRADAIRLLGKPYKEDRDISVWLYTKHQLNETYFYSIAYDWKVTNPSAPRCFCYEDSVTGWNAWIFRWDMLKVRLGFKVD
jgi:hypothetical protein